MLSDHKVVQCCQYEVRAAVSHDVRECGDWGPKIWATWRS